MTEERRKNWKNGISEEAHKTSTHRQELFIEAENLSKRIRNLTLAEKLSPLYDELKQRQREIIAELATL